MPHRDDFPLADAEKMVILRTFSRCEKKLKQLLDSFGIPNYLPLYAKKNSRRAGGSRTRVYTTWKPVFPGYLFTTNDTCWWRLILNSKWVVKPIYVNENDRLTTVRQLADITRALTNDPFINAYDHCRVGQRVRVKAGPLEGAEGLVVGRQGTEEFVINVNILGRGIGVSLPGYWLQAA